MIQLKTVQHDSDHDASLSSKMQMITCLFPCLCLSLPPSGQLAFLLENVPCNSASCRSVGRMFHIHWDQSDLGAIQNAVMATFFDIYEDVSSLH